MASGEDTLPNLPRHRLTEQAITKRNHTLSAPGLTAAIFESRSPLSSRCSSPRMKRSLDLIRVSRTEWEERETTLSALRTDRNEMHAKFRQHDDMKNNYQQLQNACVHLTQILGCTNTTDVNPDTMRNVLCPRAVQLTQEHNHLTQQVAIVNENLTKVDGELAVISVKLSGSESQVQQLKTALKSKSAEMQKLKNELDHYKQTEARTSIMLQSLRQQVSESENHSHDEHQQYSELQIEISQLKQRMKDKENEIQSLKDEVKTMQVEKTELQERAFIADAAYEEICIQLAESLSMDYSESCDFDKMLTKVDSLVHECYELSLKVESITHSNQVSEMDAKANRETILRLVSEVKKYEQLTINTQSLQQKVVELKQSFDDAERDRTSMSERLAVSRNTITALQQELKAKENSCEELRKVIEMLRAQEKEDKELQEEHTEFYKKVGLALKCNDHNIESILLAIRMLQESISPLERELRNKNIQLNEMCSQLKQKDQLSTDLRDSLDRQKSKMIEMEKDVDMCELLQQQLKQQDEKHKSFLKRIMKSLEMDSVSNEILVGDFAEDGILVRTEQLSKLESQALVEKQSALYSVQRKMKSCRQQLESKELQLGLLQRKILSLEARLSETVDKELEWKATIDRGKKTDKQMEKLQDRFLHQQEKIIHLKIDSENLEKMKDQCVKQEETLSELRTQIDTLQQSRIHLSQQLAEARHKLQLAVSQDKERADKTDEKLRETRAQLQASIQRENKLITFQTAIQQLLSTVPQETTNVLKGSPDNYDVISQIERIISSCNRYREMSCNLQASLKQLELGFKRGYQDTLTLLNTDD